MIIADEIKVKASHYVQRNYPHLELREVERQAFIAGAKQLAKIILERNNSIKVAEFDTLKQLKDFVK